MSKNYIVWLKGKENLRITNTRYVSVNNASNEGDCIGIFISTIKNFIFDIALSTLWVPGEWQYQLRLMWIDILWWIFICPYKEVLYLNIDNSCSYIHFFYVKLLIDQGCVCK